MAQLKKYLKIRDHAASHAEARASGSVGIPTLVVDDESYVIESPEAAEKLIADLGLDAEQKSSRAKRVKQSAVQILHRAFWPAGMGQRAKQSIENRSFPCYNKSHRTDMAAEVAHCT